MNGLQYRVVYRREGLRTRAKVYATKAAAERFQRLLTDGWLAAYGGVDPDHFACCGASSCFCGERLTYREDDRRRAETGPLLLWSRIESRPVGGWVPLVEQVAA